MGWSVAPLAMLLYEVHPDAMTDPVSGIIDGLSPHRHIYKTTTKMCGVKVLNEFVLSNMRKRALIHS